MMIDLHSHLLPCIDDGATDYDTALGMLKIAVKDGITHMIVTPHYINCSLDNTASIIKKEFLKFTGMIAETGLDIRLYPGSEVFIDPEVPALVKEGLICTLNDSSYVLVELPMMSIPPYTGEVIYRLKLDGFTTILAHPERNHEIQKHHNILYNLIMKGALVQINSTSLTGIYSNRVKKTALAFLRRGMVHFVASDAHTCRGRAPRLQKARMIVEAEIGMEAAKMLFETNGLSVISNKVIETVDPEQIKDWKSGILPALWKTVAGLVSGK